jgi:hypothetical protein
VARAGTALVEIVGLVVKESKTLWRDSLHRGEEFVF